jgi:PTH1 family peptidyl-tRNA hydrolase
MHLIVGLGNPGPKYANHRHNIGFKVADEIASRHGLGPWRKRFEGEVSEGMLGTEKVLVLKPMTFMNESGRAVGAAVRYLDLDPANVIVVHDELDLLPKKVRVKLGGGTAGHNGLKSIGAHIGPHFVRVRIGIGHPGDRDFVHPHVLSDFSKEERDWVKALVEAVAEAMPMLVAGDEASFQNKVHLAINPPAPRPETKKKKEAE